MSFKLKITYRKTKMIQNDISLREEKRNCTLNNNEKNHLLLHCLLFLGTMIMPLEVNLCRT